MFSLSLPRRGACRLLGLLPIFACAFCGQLPAADSGSYILTPRPGPAPKINGPAVYGVRPGRPLLYRIPCTGTRPIRFSAESLPGSLRLDAVTGIITGNAPQERGEYAVTLRATNGHGQSSKRWKIVVGDTLALTPPMGWNDWYTHYDRITDKLMRQAAGRHGRLRHGGLRLSICEHRRLLDGEARLRETPSSAARRATRLRHAPCRTSVFRT